MSAPNNRIDNNMAALPVGAACYFCLGEGPDEEGKPLVRDCSCRGDSAGFAHLSCLTNYAEQKSKQAGEIDFDAFREPWSNCNICKQYFQGQLSLDLAHACVSFTGANYGHEGNSKLDKMKVLASLRMKIHVMSKVLANDNHNELLKVEKLRIINDLLSVVDQTKKDLNMNSWVHMPKGSVEYQYYKMLCGEYEIMLTSRDGDLEAYKKVITHFKKARAIYNLVGMPDEAKQMDMKISLATNLIRIVNNPELIDSDPSITTVATSANVQTVRNAYKDSLKTNGINSENTIHMGTLYVDMLFKQKCKIEAERLVTELAIVSRRLLGPEHNITIRTDVLLEKCKVRNVLFFA
jgi:hypothetical protein